MHVINPAFFVGIKYLQSAGEVFRRALLSMCLEHVSVVMFLGFVYIRLGHGASNGRSCSAEFRLASLCEFGVPGRNAAWERSFRRRVFVRSA